jgi:geranylgeranyl diphosphate synthase, type I
VTIDQPAPSFEALKSALDDRLAATLPPMLRRLEQVHPELEPVAAAVASFVDGGKRIRPALLQLGFWSVSGHDPAAVVGPALALELLHTCALIHDDIIDEASTRRGRASVHAGFAARHVARGLAGDAHHYGRSVAILVGDLAFVQADELFVDAALPAERVLAGFRVFTQMREEVMAGQFLDLQSAALRIADREHALAVATLKSGRYSVTRPLEIGAVLAGGGAELINGLRSFGDPLGRAFQVRDDLLGVFGSSTDTGKSTASDLAEGKRTLLVAEAYARGSDADRRALDRWLGDPSLDDEQTERLRSILDTTGARLAAERFVETSIEEALAALDRLPASDAVRAELAEVTNRLGFRLT